MEKYSLKELIRSDYLRIRNNLNFFKYITTYLSRPCAKYMFWLRLTHKYEDKRHIGGNIFTIIILLLCKIMYRHYSLLIGVQIPTRTKIGKAFYFAHYSGIVINADAIIGDNVTIYNEVTIGYARSHKTGKEGVPTIGNGVVIFPGAKIIGPITVGDYSIISPNAVVINDVPTGSVVGGIPAKVISTNGSYGYFNN